MDASVRLKTDVHVSKSYLVIGVSTMSLVMENLVDLLKIKIEDEHGKF